MSAAEGRGGLARSKLSEGEPGPGHQSLACGGATLRLLFASAAPVWLCVCVCACVCVCVRVCSALLFAADTEDSGRGLHSNLAQPLTRVAAVCRVR
jgi:hypothetical protein